MKVIMTKREVATRMAQQIRIAFNIKCNPDEIIFNDYGVDFMTWEQVDRPLPDDYPVDAKDAEEKWNVVSDKETLGE